MQFWEDSWEWAPLQLRTPIVGNSESIFNEPRHLKDQTLLPLPTFVANTLKLEKDWNALNARRLKVLLGFHSSVAAEPYLVKFIDYALNTAKEMREQRNETLRSVDMSYLIYRQLNYPMDKWWKEMIGVRNKLAKENNLELRNEQLNWRIID